MQVQWTQGATQPGSSGAALIDADTRKVVGVLTGGTTSCSIFSGSDYFGKLSVVSQKLHACAALGCICLIGSMHSDWCHLSMGTFSGHPAKLWLSPMSCKLPQSC